MWFPIGGPFEPCIYLAPLRRYGALKILGSMMTMHLSCTDTKIRDFTDFGVTRRHQSRDHWTGYVVSYWWSIGTTCLSCTVTEKMYKTAVYALVKDNI